MNWKIILFWLLVFTGLSFFFFTFASYTFDQQEEMQLFIPEWGAIWTQLVFPGNFIRIMGLWVTQYYVYPLPAAMINAALLCSTGFVCYILLQRIADKNNNALLSLFPVVTLLKYHIQLKYVADGAWGLLIMLLIIAGVLSLHNRQTRLMASSASALLIFWIAGQLVILYGILLVAIEYLLYPSKKIVISTISLLLGCIVAYIGIRYILMLPLTDGFYDKAYHDAQMQSDSYVYYVWIRFTILVLVLLGTVRLLSLIKRETSIKRYFVTGGIITCFLVFTGYFLPDRYDVQNRMMDRMAYLARRQHWDEIIGMHYGKKIPGAVNRNFLNMALAQKGALGNRLFYFDQKGPQSLLTSYNGSYYMSILLSDIHFMIGDISLSETYALEALTLARRGGSPRAIQRMIQISLLRQEWELARKYLLILKQLPYYQQWAMHYESLMRHPKKIANDPDLKGKHLPEQENTLLGMLDMDIIWKEHLTDSAMNRIAYEYMGCSYLLAKETGMFKDFLLRTAQLSVEQPLPLHFQEAAVMILADDPASLNTFPIDSSVKQKYITYLAMEAKNQQSKGHLAAMYEQFGNTFWFYYQYKDIGK